MLYQWLDKLDSSMAFSTAMAHCDIPCKIYDPSSAQIAALTMVRMVDLLLELEQQQPLNFEQQATMVRLVSEKEAQGIKLKEEIRIIWGDYIKQPQLQQFPQIPELVHDIMLATSAAKQKIDKSLTISLLEKVNQFAEIFWQTKGVATYRAVCPYPPSQEVVYPNLLNK